MSRPPDWLKKRLIFSEEIFRTKETLQELSVLTVCESSLCPNLNECFSKAHATFLILGTSCTRSCGFCSVGKGLPQAPDPDEPRRIAEAVRRFGSRFVVVTSVTRDDLADGGAGQFVKVIEAIRRVSGDIRLEVLVPDFNGNEGAMCEVLSAHPDVFAHNIETVQRLYPLARSGSSYTVSLQLLKKAKGFGLKVVTKSSIMVGLGETDKEVFDTILDLHRHGCEILTIGQYLRPKAANLPVERFVTPGQFDEYRKFAHSLGFKHVCAGAFVRSSYYAEEMFESCKL